MDTLEQQLSAWVAGAFERAFPDFDWSRQRPRVQPAQDERFGDYQCNAAMNSARHLRLAPRAVAEKVAGQSRPDCLRSVEVAGPGFLNLRLQETWLAGHIAMRGDDESLGIPPVGRGRSVVIDYSSPNVAKPMHIGHIRSTVIGNSLDRIFRCLGYSVKADNHLGDWGTQFGILIMGYRHFVDSGALEQAPVEELERVYRESYARGREDEEWMRQARRELVKLQSGDEENYRLWRRFVDLSREEFNRIYRRLGVSFDLERGESYYRDRLPSVLKLLSGRNLLEKSEGAQVVRLDEEDLPPAIVRKSDGGFNYMSTDVATVLGREEDFQPDLILYVTDERQQLHFRQLFAICRRLGVRSELKHLWFGLMRLPEGTFSTRQGNVIKLEALLDEAEERARALVAESSPQMPADQQAAVAQAVGIGAVKYADLSQNPQSLVTFSWEKALNLNGNSAPYLQYACARIASVEDNYRRRFPGGDLSAAPILLKEETERRLAVRLARYPDMVIRAADLLRPNILADYLYDLAQTYSGFYQNVPFLKAPEGVRESRVRLCRQVAATLRHGLSLLGIEAPDRI